MEVSRRAANVGTRLRSLSVRDLEVEMDRVAVEVTKDLADRRHPARFEGPCVPLRVSAGDFVRRMSRFMCFN